MCTAIASRLRASSYLVSVKPATPVPLPLVLTQKGKRFPFSIRDTQGRLSPDLQIFSGGTDFRNHLVFLICFFGKKFKWIIHELTVTEQCLMPSSAVTIPLPIIQTCIVDYKPDGQPTRLLLTHYASEPSCSLNSILFGTGNSTFQCTGGYFQLPSFPSPISIISFFSLF